MAARSDKSPLRIPGLVSVFADRVRSAVRQPSHYGVRRTDWTGLVQRFPGEPAMMRPI
jgi:hypothetical protein